MIERAVIFLYFVGSVVAGACFARANVHHFMANESEWTMDFVGDIFIGGAGGLSVALLVAGFLIAVRWVFTGRFPGDD